MHLLLNAIKEAAQDGLIIYVPFTPHLNQIYLEAETVHVCSPLLIPLIGLLDLNLNVAYTY